jgi:hypothetical protein
VSFQVQIEEIAATVRAVDGETLLAPRTLARIVAAVLAAVEAREGHAERLRAETGITGGVASEQSDAGGGR